MEDKLKNLRSAMKQTVFSEQRFGDQQKRMIRHKAKAESNMRHWWPSTLSIIFVVFFLGFGVYLVNGEHSPSNNADNLKTEKIAEPVNAPGEESDGSQSAIQVDLPEDTPIEINEELRANLSIPLNLRDELPYVNTKPTVAATAHKTGYNVSVYYPMKSDTHQIALVENVEAPDLIADTLVNRVPIAEDEQEVEMNGHTAFYSEDQKEMHIFTKERYFTVFGAEKEKLFEIASLIDLTKPVAAIAIKELEFANMETVELTEIEEKNYIPVDFHERVEFLQASAQPITLASKGEGVSWIANHYTSPITGFDIVVEQMYEASGEHKLATHSLSSKDLISTIELEDRTILLMTDGQNYTGYFAEGNYSFLVTGDEGSIGLEQVEEILQAIELK